MDALHLDFAVLFMLGLASSLHCVTMCGPLIVVASAPWISSTERAGWLPLLMAQVSYHLGRGLTYILLGGILGATGLFITQLFPSRGIGALVQITVGCAFLVAGLLTLRRTRKTAVLPSTNLLSRLMQYFITAGHSRAMLGLGWVTGFLPCGILYMAFSGSLAAGSFWQGASWMLAFWLGTMPLLFITGIASQRLFHLGGRAAAVLLAIAMLVSGGWLTAKGYRSWTQTTEKELSLQNVQDRLRAGIGARTFDSAPQKCH